MLWLTYFPPSWHLPCIVNKRRCHLQRTSTCSPATSPSSIQTFHKSPCPPIELRFEISSAALSYCRRIIDLRMEPRWLVDAIISSHGTKEPKRTRRGLPHTRITINKLPWIAMCDLNSLQIACPLLAGEERNEKLPWSGAKDVLFQPSIRLS